MRDQANEARRRSIAWGALFIAMGLLLFAGVATVLGWVLVAAGLVFVACAAAPADWWGGDEE